MLLISTEREDGILREVFSKIYFSKIIYEHIGNSKIHQTSDNQNNYGLVSYRLKNTLSDFGSVSRGVCKVKNGKLTSINEHLKIEKSDGIIKDFESGNILDKDDYVSMNFWLCRSNFFNHLDTYIKETMEKLTNIEKDEIYLPFAAQKLLMENLISIDVVDSNSEWFGVTYREDKEASVEKLKLFSEKGIYPIPVW